MRTNVLFIGFLLGFSCICYAQKQLCFSYDSSGNQTNATICLYHLHTKTSEIFFSDERPTETDFFSEEEAIEEVILKAAPNPTEGNLTIFWHHHQGRELVRLFISSVDMRILYDNTSINSSQEHLEINIYSYVPAVYYLVGIFQDGTKKTFRIIKK